MKKMTEKIALELLSIAKKFVSNYLEKRKWVIFFGENLDFLANNSNADLYDKQLSNLFSDDKIKKMSSLMVKNNGFTYYQVVEKEVSDTIFIWDVEENFKRLFISRFMDSLDNHLKENYPEYYQQYIVYKSFEVLKETKNDLIEIKNDLSELKKMVSKPNKVFDLYSINWTLINSSDKKINLTFFESDDEEFINQFHDFIDSKSNLYLYSNSRYEALFAVLSELKKIGKNAYIVMDENDWTTLANDSNFYDSILIPFFMSNFIPAIPHNINIFIYDNEYECTRNDKFEIKKRKYQTILDRLSFFGYSYEEEIELLDKTHGFFQPLFKRLFNKSFTNSEYSIDEKDVDTIICGLLLGQWKDCPGDIDIIEILSDTKYEAFISVIEKYVNGENPIFFKYSIYGETKYLTVSLEDALSQLMGTIKIKKTIWDNYIALIDSIIFDVDNKYKNISSEKDRFFIKNNFSDILKEGVCKSLLYIKYFSQDYKICHSIEHLIETSLKKISTPEGWANISKYVMYICELAPDIYLNQFNEELNSIDSNIVKLFQLKQDVFWGENYYINYLWSLELLLSSRKYVYKSLDILFKLNEYDFKYEMTNSPKSTLNYVFCSWTNLSCIKDFEKVRVLEKYIKINKKNVKFALDNLPLKNGTIVGGLYSPKYLISEVDTSTNRNDVILVFNGYLDLCISNMECDLKIIIDLISDISQFPKNRIISFFNHLNDIIINFNDEEKYTISLKIREEVYRHRFHINAEWALNFEDLNVYIESLNKIEFENKVYNYKYLFESSHDFPLLNPIPFETKDYSIVWKENQKKQDEIINSQIKEFKLNNYKLTDLIQVIDSQSTNLGNYIHCFIGKYFDVKTTIDIMKYQKNNRILEQYAREILVNDKENYYPLLDVIRENNCTSKDLCDVLYLSDIDEELVKYLDSINDNEIKKLFWSRNHWFTDETLKICDTVFENVKKYGNAGVYIDDLYRIKNQLTSKKVYELATGILDCDPKITGNIQYELGEIFNAIKNIELDGEKIDILASIELKYSSLLDWHQMYFLELSVSQNADIYSQIINSCFKDDNGNSKQLPKKYTSFMFSLYHKMKFCPGTKDGIVDQIKFEQWCELFKEKLIENNQIGLFDSMMGQLLAYSPINADGYPLADCVRDFIEAHFSKKLLSSFVASEMNKRGVYSRSYGEEEEKISINYKNIADHFRMNYPKCAEIYDCISEDYHIQSDNEKQRSRYE